MAPAFVRDGRITREEDPMKKRLGMLITLALLALTANLTPVDPGYLCVVTLAENQEEETP